MKLIKRQKAPAILLIAIMAILLIRCTPYATYTIQGVEDSGRVKESEAGQGLLRVSPDPVLDTITLVVTSQEIGNRTVGDTVRLPNTVHCCMDFIVISKNASK